PDSAHPVRLQAGERFDFVAFAAWGRLTHSARSAGSAMRERLRQRGLHDLTALGFGLTLAALVFGGMLGYWNVRRLARNDEWVAHTDEVVGQLEGLLSMLKDAETGQRGFLLTEDSKYLEPYDDALLRVNRSIGRLQELMSDSPDQQARLAEVELKVAQKL